MPSNDERWLDAEAGPVVRPYALTQGRTRHAGESFDLVATVLATHARIADPSSLAPEHVSVHLLAAGAAEVQPPGELERKLALGRPLRVKLGVDPTTSDIHLGHTVVLNKLREFQDAGHRVVLIIGDYTARVGDPSGRSATRPQLPPEEIDAHARTFQEQAFRVLDRDRWRAARDRSSGWIPELSALDF